MNLPYKSGKVTLTSHFGWRTLNGSRDYHKGVDLSGTDKTLVAPCDGVIGSSTIITDKSNLTWQWGNYIRIDTPDGLKIFMCHMASRKVKVGQKVKAGDVVGIEGNTGYSFGSHCHFEVRKNGVSVDPTPYLGIPNEWGQYDVKTTPKEPTVYKDSYDKDGITYTRAKNFAIIYHDADKRKGGVKRYINGGFFANYRSEDGEVYTLPVANLACDIKDIPAAKGNLYEYIYGDHLIYSIADNATKQFAGKKVSTLLVPYSGKPTIERVDKIPSGIKYAVSGVPIVVDKKPVDMTYVGAEGWDGSTTYGTSRNMLGIRNGEIWVLTLKTTSANYIKSGEVWKKIQNEGFEDVIALDGGGSYIRVEGIKRRSTGGSRAVNNIIAF
nr:MAG TPA: peptidase [Caudoviricetes sp.]